MSDVSVEDGQVGPGGFDEFGGNGVGTNGGPVRVTQTVNQVNDQNQAQSQAQAQGAPTATPVVTLPVSAQAQVQSSIATLQSQLTQLQGLFGL
jgi:hypothetical protein